MEWRAFVVVATLNLLAAGAVWAQQPARQSRVGIITTGGNPRSAAFFAAFEPRLRELGWIDGKNLTFETGESPEQLSAIATCMVVQQRMDVIVTVGPEPALKAASEATRTIPIVSVALNDDPVEKGYVTSLARPGGNIAGIFFRDPEVGPTSAAHLPVSGIPQFAGKPPLRLGYPRFRAPALPVTSVSSV